MAKKKTKAKAKAQPKTQPKTQPKAKAKATPTKVKVEPTESLKEEVKVEPQKTGLTAQELLDSLTFHKVDFPAEQYYKASHPKKQIYVHHTVSGEGAGGDINWWLSTATRVATAIIIDRKGDIWQCFSSRYWGHHLGIKSQVFKENGVKMTTRQSSSGKVYYSNNTILNETSIGVELDSWGWLELKDGKYYSYTGKEVPAENVQVYEDGYKGKKYYEKYTQAQIDAFATLCKYWNLTYGIPLQYQQDMWDISKEALEGKEGVWTHTSVRSDKSDCHPQPELITALKSLSK